MKLPLICLLSVLFLIGCAVGPDYEAPPGTNQHKFRSNAAGTLATPPDEAELQAWWKGFGDATLNELVAETIAHNLDVQASVAAIKAARAQRNVSVLDLAPIVTSSGSYTNSRSAQLNTIPGFERDQEIFGAGFDSTWELDLFGHVRRNIEAQSAELGASEAIRDDLLVSVTAETGRAYMELCGLQNQLSVARSNVANQQQTLDLTKRLMEGGRGTDLDIARAQAQLSNTQATIPPLEGAIAKFYHRLAVLAGQTPDTLRDKLKVRTGVPKPPSIELGDPASLLRRRPDIRAAERQLAAATARIGVATAELFPIITANGSVGLSAASLGGLGDGGSDRFSFGPSINWAFLDSPRRLQLVKAAGARTEAQLAVYQQTVLLALEDVENVIVDYGREQVRRGSLAEAVQASNKAATLARERYNQGGGTFLEVLDAERVKLQLESSLAASQTLVATYVISVFKALGGGWRP